MSAARILYNSVVDNHIVVTLISNLLKIINVVGIRRNFAFCAKIGVSKSFYGEVEIMVILL